MDTVPSLENYEYIDYEGYFDVDMAISLLLNVEKIAFCTMDNNLRIYVNCSDVFAWGISDGEDIDYYEIEDLYRHYIRDKVWGTQIWCIKKRGELPQKPVYDDIKKRGKWDLDSLNLTPNFYDSRRTMHESRTI